MPGDWKWFFHGLECDFRNIHDGRYVRVDFTTEKYQHTSVMQFVMTTCPPWGEYPELKTYFADDEQPPYDYLSGNHSKMMELYEELEQYGYFEASDEELVKLNQKYTFREKDEQLGQFINIIRIPDELMPENPEDIDLCDREVLSEKAYGKLDEILKR